MQTMMLETVAQIYPFLNPKAISLKRASTIVWPNCGIDAKLAGSV